MDKSERSVIKLWKFGRSRDYKWVEYYAVRTGRKKYSVYLVLVFRELNNSVMIIRTVGLLRDHILAGRIERNDTNKVELE